MAGRHTAPFLSGSLTLLEIAPWFDCRDHAISFAYVMLAAIQPHG